MRDNKQFNDKTPINGEGAECPYCGYVHGDMWESSPNDGDTEVIECGGCEKKFESSTCITVDYRTKPLECETHEYSDDDWASWFKIEPTDYGYDPKTPNLHYSWRECSS